MQPLFARLSGQKAHTYSLVLSAVGIAHQVSRQGSMWSIAVPPANRTAAIEAVSLYLKENPKRSEYGSALLRLGSRTYSAWYIAAVLALIHLLIATGPEQRLFTDAFGADAGQILTGDLYRCVTALLLHADGQHLLGNMAGLIIFGTVVASICGWGLGWFLILASGFAGNLFTAFWYRQDHLSIGASTAVFGAVGICTYLSLRIGMWKKDQHAQRSWRQWMPLAAGLALLAFLGTSPHADLMAHLSGFVSGLMIGFLGCVWGFRSGRLPGQAPEWLQWSAALAASGIIAACWLKGFLFYNG